MIKKLIGAGVIAILIIVVVGILVFKSALNRGVKYGIEEFGPMITGTTVTLEDVKISALSGEGELVGLVVGNPKGFETPELFSARTIRVRIRPGSILKDKVIVEEVFVDSPQMTYEHRGGTTNVKELLKTITGESGEGSGEGPSEPPPPTGEEASSKKLQVDKLTIQGTKVKANFAMLADKTVGLSLPSIELDSIGASPEGATPREVVAAVVRAIGKSVQGKLKDVSGELGGLAGKGGEAGKKVTEKAGETLKGLGGFLKKSVKAGEE